MKLIFLGVLALGLSGCSTTDPVIQTRVVEVVSSKPYRFIQWSMDDSPETRAAIRAHNRRHQAVIDAEKRGSAEP